MAKKKKTPKKKESEGKTESELLDRLRELRSELHAIYAEEKKYGLATSSKAHIKEYVTKPRSEKQVSKIDKISAEIDEIISHLHSLGTKAA